MLSTFAGIAASIGHARLRYLLVAWGAAVGLVIAAAFASFVFTSRSAAIVRAEQDLGNLSMILAEEVNSGLQGIDLLESALIDHMREAGIDSAESFDASMRSYDVHLDLVRRAAGLSQLTALSLHNASGDLINFSLGWPPPQFNSRGSEFIRSLLTATASRTFIGVLPHSTVTGEPTIYISRRFEDSGGRLIGVVLCTMLVEHFERVFSRIAASPDAAFDLYRSDGVLLARYPRREALIGVSLGSGANFRRVLGSLGHGATRVTSVIDGKDRLVAAHAVPYFPLLLAASDTTDAVLKTWRSEARAFLGATVFLELSSLAR